MKICFPITTGEGLDSSIYGHFASTPWFLIVDAGSGQSCVVANCDPYDIYAGCNPFMALRDLKLDGIVVGGIGNNALRTMNMCGFRVYQAESASVRENVELFEGKQLQEIVVLTSDWEGKCSDQDDERNCGHCHV